MKRMIVASAVCAGMLALAGGLATMSGGAKAPSGGKGAGAARFSLAAPGSAGALTAAAGKGSLAADPVTITVGPKVTPVVFNGDVRSLPLEAPDRSRVRPELERESVYVKPGAPPSSLPATPRVASAMPAPSQNFAGLAFTPWGAGHPPDTVGDVGPNHYVQAVNTSIGIFNKTGTQLAAFTFDTLFNGTNLPCDNDNQGDPTVIYDRLANRFIVADFAWAAGALQNGPYYECIAVSQTGDPVAGGWFLYAVRTDDATHPWLADYPKMGHWPDGLYMTANMFDCLTASCSSATFNGVRVWAFDRTDLVAGAAVDQVIVDISASGCATNVDPCYASLLPSTMTATAPPAGRENLLVSEDQLQYNYEVWKFKPVYGAAGTTFTGPTNVAQAPYPFEFPLVPTPGNSLDSLSDRMMMQNQYTNIGGVESLWVNHTVETASGAPVLYGIQWAQLGVTGGTVAPAPVQQQTYANVGADAQNRWMGSLAVDKNGNMALGYSVANANNRPDIRYSGRLVGDPASTLAQGEAELVNGTGTQLGSCGGTCTRWGDYSAMALDPDNCTFWYTTEHYNVDGLDWQTRIGSFRYPNANCSQTPTGVSVTRFAAGRTPSGVVLSWRSGSEADVLGFNVWRGQTKVNRTLIAAKRSGKAAGAAYRFVDRAARASRNASYRLQVVDLKGKRSWYGSAAIAR